MCYRGKLQYLQGTTSYKDTTNLRRLTVNCGNDRFFYFHKLGWSGNKLKSGQDVLTENCYYGHFYVIFIFGFHDKKSSQQSGIPLA